MENRVLSFRVAVSKGYEPRLYMYDPAKIPLGEMDAALDFKTWSKRIIAINCYFTKTDTGEKFVVTVYCQNKTGRYILPGSMVDFGQCPANSIYRIDVATIENKGKTRIQLVFAEQKMIRTDRV
jgi:hypothetical protein